MKIQWAVFGEKQRGHDLLATSGERTFAEAIAQFTDRPGDPPVGVSWGPSDSGFVFKGHYVFLRTIPDLNAGRAGMVCSYAAFVSLDEIEGITSIASIFDQLPQSIVPPDTLSVLEQTEILSFSETQRHVPGLAGLVEKLIEPDRILPLVWTHQESWLPVLDAVWKHLPRCLRIRFCFAFQFEPEHKLPQKPTIVATLPQLRGRWESTQITTFKTEASMQATAAQRWLLGDPNASGFSETLKKIGITNYGFGELDLLSRLVEFMDSLSDLGFKDVLKAVRILEKHLKICAGRGPEQSRLFECLAARVVDATQAELVALRNLDSEALGDLIPLLQDATRTWLERAGNLGAAAGVIEAALGDKESWWSKTVLEWSRKTSLLQRELDSRIICCLVLASEKITEFILGCLPRTDIAEKNFIHGLPPQLGESSVPRYLDLAESLEWMRLHAVVLARSQMAETAIMLHALSAKERTEGFDQLVEVLGVLPLITLASKSEHGTLDRYVGGLLEPNVDLISDEVIERGTRWANLLTAATAPTLIMPGGRIRDLTVKVIERDLPSPSAVKLADQSTKLDPSIWLDMIDPVFALNRLPVELKAATYQAINGYLESEICVQRLAVLEKAIKLHSIVDHERLVGSLQRLDNNCYADVGIRVFEFLNQIPDALMQRWLVELFTRTYPQGITQDQATRVANILCSKDHPISAEVVRETAEHYHRSDVLPILERIRYKYKMTKQPPPEVSFVRNTLPVVLIATALPLERSAVVAHLGAIDYDEEARADIGSWPSANPSFEIWLVTTGAGNLDALSSVLGVLHKMHKQPCLAFFVGVGGGVKDSEIGDVIYSTKVYHYEGGKEEDDGVVSRPNLEHTSEDLVQLAIRIADRAWQPDQEASERKPKATPAVIASGEKVLTSTKASAQNYRRIKKSMNDTQVVDMEGFGFLKACHREKVEHAMVLRGVSDKLAHKSESDALGNQPLAVKNATAFLFGLLGACAEKLNRTGKKKPKKKKRFLGIF